MAEINNFHVYEMDVYKGKQDKASILMEGDCGYPERHFVVIRTRLGHPCAYIEVKPNDYAMNVALGECDEIYDMFDIDVHGGPTYYGAAHWNEEDKRLYVGWDYAHAGDYEPYYSDMHYHSTGHKWTLFEIFEDIVSASIGIRQQNDKHWEETHALPVERDGT